MIRLLHAADFHLDSAFSGLSPEQAALRRREQRLALNQLSELCRGVDLVLLSGDLFDSHQIYRETREALKALFASTNAEFFIAPGNHDYVTETSPYLTEPWGENVHIFTRSVLQRVHLERWNCDLYGAAFTAGEMPPMLKDFRVEDPSALNLMVLHGEVQSHSAYNPITAQEIAQSGIDYLALGHIHLRGEQRFGKTLCAWPGCLMGRGFDECGQKGVYLVNAEKNHCSVEFVPVFTRKYEILNVEAGENPEAALRAALHGDHKKDCYRILLTGESDAVNVAALEEAFSPEFFSLSIRDHTVPPRTLWAGAGEDTLRGHFLADLKAQYEAGDEAQRRKIVMAAKLVTSLMDGREVSL